MSGDKILIRDLRVRGIIGLNEWEREKRQDILINLTLGVDCRAAGGSDDVAYAESSEHFLVEALATGIARICVVDFAAEQVVVRVEKPGALRFADSVGVEIHRARADFDRG